MGLLDERRKRKDMTRVAKVSSDLYKETSLIALKRFQAGKDKRYSPPTVQRKILRHSLWPKIRADLEAADFLDE